MKYFILLLVLFLPLKASSQLSMPIGGEQNKDWWVWTYVNNNPDTAASSITSNFKCSSYAYHWFGLVFVLKNLQLMDKGIPVLAAAPGKIVALYNGSNDRTKQSDTGGHGNFITIQHNPNLFTYYGFLKKNSMRVKRNQIVKKGDTIAFVGSSGVAYDAKLYFRVDDSLGTFRDPLGYACGSPPYSALLTPGPIYDTSFGLIDFGVTNHAQYSDDTLIERPPTLSEISTTDDDYACVWMEAKNIFQGDQVGSLWTDPHGKTFWDKRNDAARGDFHFGYDRNYSPTYNLDTGIWNVTFYYNYDSVCHLSFHVVQAHSGVSQSDPIIQPITFPQPSKDHATINGVTAKEAHLYDVEAVEQPMRFDNYPEGVTIFWQNLRKGVYYLSIKDEKGILHRAKIMVSP